STDRRGQPAIGLVVEPRRPGLVEALLCDGYIAARRRGERTERERTRAPRVGREQPIAACRELCDVPGPELQLAPERQRGRIGRQLRDGLASQRDRPVDVAGGVASDEHPRERDLVVARVRREL